MANVDLTERERIEKYAGRMTTVKLKTYLAWLAVLAILVTSACSGGSNDAAEPPTENESAEKTEEPEEAEDQKTDEFPYYAPLTGVGLEEAVDQRVIGVMIDNHNKARPQTGLGQADIVYEVLAEGWITRFAALFHSDIPEVIGPVRSIRPYYIDIITGFDGVLTHAGGSPAATEEVNAQGLASINNNGSGGFAFYRDDSRSSPHNLYTGKEQLLEGLERFGYEEDYTVPTLSFLSEDEAASGSEAESIQIDYASSYSVGYEYDTNSKLYTRYTQGSPHRDLVTDQPVTMSNVLVIETSHQILDDAGRRAIDVEGEGKGYLFQRGFVQEVDWKKEDGVIRPYVNGEEAGLYPGKTWVNIIPNQPGLQENVRIQ